MDSQPVLVNVDDLSVLKDGLVLGPDGSQVDRHEKGGGEDGPHGHLRLALLVAQPKVADDQHVGIVPVARAGVGNDGVLVVAVVVDDAGHRLPTVLDVVKVPPDVAGANDGRVIGLLRIDQGYFIIGQ